VTSTGAGRLQPQAPPAPAQRTSPTLTTASDPPIGAACKQRIETSVARRQDRT
jgi:hypothetical protein